MKINISAEWLAFLKKVYENPQVRTDNAKRAS